MTKPEPVAEAAGTPNWNAALGRFVLQPVLLAPPGYGFAPKLYHVTLRGTVAFRAGALWLAPESAVGFNAYANSFYAAYWARLTDLAEVEISGRILGRGFVRLFRVISPHAFHDLGLHVIGRKDATEPEPFRIAVPLRTIQNPAASEGRLFFDIVSDGECEVTDLAWTSARPPLRPVSLSVGICTYRKEDLLAANLENLERFLATPAGACVDRIFVVNNDRAPIAHPVARGVAAREPRIEILDQRNLGGAGGFTRSLVESLARSPSTHHVMIDDDVFLDPEVIAKAALVLGYAREDLVLGGQMMNMMKPQTLYEGGAKLSRTGLLERVGVNIDCARPDAIGFFDRFRAVDYNAWWFCAIPKRAVHEVGLPLNIFIRGDDFEYAIRLGARGFRTVSMPGIYVWHEPFEGKTSAWLEYYNMRNRMIFSATHAPEGGYEQLGRSFYAAFCDEALAAGDWEKLGAVLLGIADFLAGPDRHFARDAEANHGEVRTLLAALREDQGRLAAGPGHQALAQALGERIQGFDLFHAAELERLHGEDGLVPALSGRAQVTAEWNTLADAVLAAFDEQVAAAHRLWGERTPGFATPDYWAGVFGTAPAPA